MAKQKKSAGDGMFDTMATETGGTVLKNVSPVKYYIDTGNLAVNAICSGSFLHGGLPGGRIIEILGPASGGKSLWGTNFIRGVQAIQGFPVYLDCENALNPEFAARASHINPSEIVHFRPADGIYSLERVFLKVHNVMNKVREAYPDTPLGFVFDSISVPPSERELRETNLSEDFGEAEWKKKVGAKEQPGERAKICNKEFRKLESTLEKKDATMLVINQIRQKIGVYYGNPEVGSTASTVLEFYSCIRLRVSAHKKIMNTKLGTVIGINLKVKNIKNRIYRPFMEVEDVQLFYDIGVNPLSGLLTTLIQFERIEPIGKGIYGVKEPWANGQSITFKGSKSANMVDPEVLYQCPALVDAKDEKEIRDYLAIFGAAINQTLSDEVQEKDILSDTEDDSEKD